MTDRNSLAERTFDVRGQDDVGNDTIDDDHNPNEEEEDDDDKKPPASLPSFEEPLAMQERFDQDDDVPAVEGDHHHHNLGGSLQSSLLNSSESDEDRKRSASELDDHPFHGELFAEPDEQFDAAAAAVQREQEQQQQQEEHAHQGNAKRPRLLRVRSPHPPYHHAVATATSDRDRRPFVEHRVSMTFGTHGYHYGMGTPPTGYYRSTIHSNSNNMASPAPMQAPSLAMPGYVARSPMRQPPPPLASQPAPSPIVSSSAFGERSQQHSSRYAAAPSPHSYQPSQQQQQQAPPPHQFMHHHSYEQQPSPGGYAYASPAHHPHHHHHHHQHPPHAYATAWSASPSYAYPPYAAAQHSGESPRGAGGYDYHHSHPEPPLPPPPPLEGATARGPPAAAAAAALVQLPDRIPRGPSPEELEEARTQRARAALNTWYQRYEELIQYKRQNGHCNVPQKYEPNQQLGIWVNKQRMEKKAYDEPGKASSMTEHKIQALELIGFAWAKRKGEAAWMEKYEELKEYKRIHGNCEVPTKFRENPALGRWVSTQRSNYRLRVDNDDKSKLTDEKFDLLEQLGFRWRMMNSNGS